MTAPTGVPPVTQSTVKKWLRSCLIAVLALGLPLGTYILYTRATGNFHEVSKNQAYRSGQLTVDQLQIKAAEHGLRSVINLRGRNAGKDWYDQEIAFCLREGIKHYDIPLSAGTQLSPQKVEGIIEVIKNAPKPLLIHCKDGADRAALGAALYRFSVEGQPPDQADDELTIWYGHIPMITPHVAAMDRSFWAYVHARSKSSPKGSHDALQ